MEYYFTSACSKNHGLIKNIFEDYFPELEYNKKNLKFVKKLTEKGKYKDLYKNKNHFEELVKCVLSQHYDNGLSILINKLMTKKSLNILKYFALNCLHDMKVIDNNGGDILFLATEMNFQDFIEWLLHEHNFELNKVNDKKETILYYAVRWNHFELMKWLITDKKMDVNHLDFQDNNILFTICENNNFEICKWLLENTNINYNQLNYRNENCLFSCMFEFGEASVNYDLIKYMIYEKKINKNHEDKGGYTMLYYAQKPEIVDFLVDEIGMNLNHISKVYGTNILFSSVIASDKELTTYFIEKRGMCKEKVDKRGTNLLMSSVRCEDNKDMINWLLSRHNFDINYRNKLGYNIVYIAAQYLDYKLIKWLIMDLKIDYITPIYSGQELIDELLFHSKKDSEFKGTIKFIKWLIKNTKLEIKFNYIYSIFERCKNNCKKCSCLTSKNIDTKQIEIFLKEFNFNINFVDPYYKNTILVNSIINRYDNSFISWIINNDEIDLFLEKDEIGLKEPSYYAIKYNNQHIFELLNKKKKVIVLKLKFDYDNLKERFLDSIREMQSYKETNEKKIEEFDNAESKKEKVELSIKLSVIETKNIALTTKNEKLEAYISKLKLQLMLNSLEPEYDSDIDI
jgi:ankyrin repeat protein